MLISQLALCIYHTIILEIKPRKMSTYVCRLLYSGDITRRYETIIFIRNTNVIPVCSTGIFDRITYINKVMLCKERIFLDRRIFCPCPGTDIKFCCIYHSHPFRSLVKMTGCFCRFLIFSSLLLFLYNLCKTDPYPRFR